MAAGRSLGRHGSEASVSGSDDEAEGMGIELDQPNRFVASDIATNGIDAFSDAQAWLDPGVGASRRP